MSLDSDARKNILTQFTREVWSEGNIDASDNYIAQKYTIFHDPGDPWEGRELDLAGYKERVKILRAAFPDQLFDIQGLFADGKAVVMTWLWSATHKGDCSDRHGEEPLSLSGGPFAGGDEGRAGDASPARTDEGQ